MFHLLLHISVPLLVATTVYRARWLRSYVCLMGGMLIDVDHVFADPVYDPMRCSIGFHPLHTLIPILVYAALLVPQRTRLFGIGLCLHIILDSADCYTTNGIFFQ